MVTPFETLGTFEHWAQFETLPTSFLGIWILSPTVHCENIFKTVSLKSTLSLLSILLKCLLRLFAYSLPISHLCFHSNNSSHVDIWHVFLHSSVRIILLSDIIDLSMTDVHKDHKQHSLDKSPDMFRYAWKAFILQSIYRVWFAGQRCCISWSAPSLQQHGSFSYLWF